jgi:hypothetical protein
VESCTLTLGSGLDSLYQPVQVLSRDIRSVHQRLHTSQVAQQVQPSSGVPADSACQREGVYQVVLEGIRVGYDIGGGQVVIQGASVAQAPK